MKKIIRSLSSFAIASAFLLSCQTENVKDLTPNNGDNYTVTLDEAKVICGNNNGNAKARIGSDKPILSAKSKKNKNGEAVYHVITYENNKGYKVISADKRAFPLLVESESGQFDTTVTGVAIWMHGLEGYIEKQRAKILEKGEDKYMKSIWKDFEETGDALKQIKSKKKGRVASVPDDGGGGSNCQDSYQANENVLNTAWSQWGGYNTFCPEDPCGFANNGYCGKIPAGCGAVSMAQIMFRHQRPLGFNYGIMPGSVGDPFSCSFNAGETEMGRLIKYAVDKAGSKSITTSLPWSCSTSTATFPWEIPSAFSDAGYSSGGNSQDYVFSNNVTSDLLQGFPIIVSGTKGWVLNFSDWHIWVADGVRTWTISGEGGQCWTGGQIHFNMGWGGQQNNWYYAPYSMGYDTQVKSITNIRP